MEDSTAEGLAGGGALLAAASLAAPWYSVTIDGPLAAQVPSGMPSLGSQSGWAALGQWHWLVLALALVAGWRAAARFNPVLPALAGLGLLIVAAVAFIAPPDASGLITDRLPDVNGDPLASAFAEGLIGSFTEQLGLALKPAVGLALAGVGAVAALVGAMNRATQP